jgi:hypothetical protein
LCEVGNILASGDGEACAQIIPEFEAVLGAGLEEREKGVATVAACIAAGSTADAAFGDLAADVVFGAVGVERNVGSFEHPQQFAFVGAQAPQEAVESAIEARRQGRLARWGWVTAPSFETAVEQPDQGANAALRGALSVGEGIEFVDKTFGMDPAQAMLTDVELTGVVADDHGVGEQTMRLDSAPQSALGGDLRTGSGLTLRAVAPIWCR